VFWTNNVDAAVEEIVSLHPTMGFNKPFVFWLEAGRAPLKVNYLVSPPYHVLAPEIVRRERKHLRARKGRLLLSSTIATEVAPPSSVS
jgi:hypothetical protein